MKINYTETLNVSDLLNEEGQQQNDPKYTLRGVLEHEGGATRGHYTNLTVTKDDIICNNNDEAPNAVKGAYDSKYAYMLLHVCVSSCICMWKKQLG